jgi:hypothetical protein
MIHSVYADALLFPPCPIVTPCNLSPFHLPQDLCGCGGTPPGATPRAARSSPGATPRTVTTSTVGDVPTFHLPTSRLSPLTVPPATRTPGD